MTFTTQDYLSNLWTLKTSQGAYVVPRKLFPIQYQISRKFEKEDHTSLSVVTRNGEYPTRKLKTQQAVRWGNDGPLRVPEPFVTVQPSKPKMIEITPPEIPENFWYLLSWFLGIKMPGLLGNRTYGFIQQGLLDFISSMGDLNSRKGDIVNIRGIRIPIRGISKTFETPRTLRDFHDQPYATTITSSDDPPPPPDMGGAIRAPAEKPSPPRPKPEETVSPPGPPPRPDDEAGRVRVHDPVDMFGGGPYFIEQQSGRGPFPDPDDLGIRIKRPKIEQPFIGDAMDLEPIDDDQKRPPPPPPPTPPMEINEYGYPIVPIYSPENVHARSKRVHRFDVPPYPLLPDEKETETSPSTQLPSKHIMESHPYHNDVTARMLEPEEDKEQFESKEDLQAERLSQWYVSYLGTVANAIEAIKTHHSYGRSSELQAIAGGLEISLSKMVEGASAFTPRNLKHMHRIQNLYTSMDRNIQNAHECDRRMAHLLSVSAQLNDEMAFVQDREQNVQNMEDRIQQLTLREEQLYQHLNELDRQRSIHRTEELERENASSRQMLDNTIIERDALQEELQTLKNQLQQSELAVTDQHERIRQIHHEVKIEEEKREQHLNQNKKAVNELRQRLKDILLENTNLKQSYEEEQAQVNALRNQILKLQSERKESEETRQRLLNELQNYELKLEDMKRQLHMEYTQKLQTKENEIEHLLHQLGSMTDDHHEQKQLYENQLAELRQEIESQQTIISTQEYDYKKLDVEAGQYLGELRREHKEQLEAVQNELNHNQQILIPSLQQKLEVSEQNILRLERELQEARAFKQGAYAENIKAYDIHRQRGDQRTADYTLNRTVESLTEHYDNLAANIDLTDRAAFDAMGQLNAMGQGTSIVDEVKLDFPEYDIPVSATYNDVLADERLASVSAPHQSRRTEMNAMRSRDRANHHSPQRRFQQRQSANQRARENRRRLFDQAPQMDVDVQPMHEMEYTGGVNHVFEEQDNVERLCREASRIMDGDDSSSWMWPQMPVVEEPSAMHVNDGSNTGFDLDPVAESEIESDPLSAFWNPPLPQNMHDDLYMSNIQDNPTFGNFDKDLGKKYQWF